MTIRCVLVCLLVTATPGLAQAPGFSFGVKGGFVLSDSASYPRKGLDRYTVGPTIEASFGRHIAIEADTLYKRLEPPPVYAFYSTTVEAGSVGTITHYAVLYGTNPTSWEFPVLGKYYFGGQTRSLRIFAGAGFSLERSSTTSRTFVSSYTFVTGSPVAQVATRDRAAEAVTIERGSHICPGPAFAAGFTWRKGKFRLTPEFRYVRWGDLPYQPGRNQPELLIGLSL